jgi:hypothetical protein
MSNQDEIKSVEARLEKRREIIARRFEDVKLELSSAASKAVRSWPVFAVAGGLAAGYAISRGVRHRSSVPSSVHYVPVRTADGASPRTRNLLAAVLGIAATALKIGTSHEARVFINAVKRFRDRRRNRY